jgi:DNA-binding NarL/FixJ family response regulator
MTTAVEASEAEGPVPAVRIVVADDHEVVRAGYAGLLATQADFTVVGTACDGAEAVRVCRERRPDVVLMDVRMPVMDGIQATAELMGPEAKDAPRVLILTTFDLDEHVYDALAAGASGFLLKDVTAERLFEAVRVVAAGEALLAPVITRRLIAEFARLKPRAPTGTALGVLTPRETEVLRLRDRTQAVVTAYETGLVVPRAAAPEASGRKDPRSEGPRGMGPNGEGLRGQGSRG